MEAGRNELSRGEVVRSFMGHLSVVGGIAAVKPALRAPLRGYGLDGNAAADRRSSIPERSGVDNNDCCI